VIVHTAPHKANARAGHENDATALG
jgi:hypothetical protein